MIYILSLLKKGIFRWHDADLAGKLKIEFDLSQEILGLERSGFHFLDIKRIIPRKIVRDKKSNMVIPGILAEVAQ